MSLRIKKIHAHEILDSRGNPTLEVSVWLRDGTVGVAAVPSGASTGSHEAKELRDNDKKRYGGKGVLKACGRVNGLIAKSLVGLEADRQLEIDQKMIRLDGTARKSRLGANAILAVSLAAAHAAARGLGLPLYRYLRQVFQIPGTNFPMPRVMMNLMNGGLHADTDLNLQEVMVLPIGARKMREQVRWGAEIFVALGQILQSQKLNTNLGNEGGYAPRLGSNERALKLFAAAIQKAGYQPGQEVALGLDAAASEIYDPQKKQYVWPTDRKRFLAAEFGQQFLGWFRKYPLISIEDPLAEDDWSNWVDLTKKISEIRCQGSRFKPWLVGDDLFVTNPERLQKGIKLGAANAVLVKPNQIGTLSETWETISLAKKHRYAVIISHRSGETCDSTIADLAVAVRADGLKAGSVARSERSSKYNRLLAIEEELEI